MMNYLTKMQPKNFMLDMNPKKYWAGVLFILLMQSTVQQIYKFYNFFTVEVLVRLYGDV